MVVNFTSNLALAKPTESEIAKNWVANTQLQDDNNVIITAKTDLQVASYTPTLVATTTPPGLGTGTAKGEYQLVENFVFGSFLIEFLDAGISSGSGEYGFSLPFPVDGVYHTVGTALNQIPGNLSCIGEGYIYDATVINNSGSVAIDAVTISGVSYARLVTETFAGKTNRMVGGSMPFALANNDKFFGNFFYRKA